MNTSMKLKTLLSDYVKTPLSDLDITGIALDSRYVMPGNVFLAYRGTHTNGREYIDEAIAKGAVAILVDQDEGDIVPKSVPVIALTQLIEKIGHIAGKFYDYPSQKMAIVGITGTNGKTSCSHFVAQATELAGKKCGVIGTLGNGIYHAIQPSSLTTPDAITLQRLLSDFVELGADYVSMEVSSHSLEQKRVQGITFAVAIFTNLTRDHLDYHGTMENYGKAKKQLFEMKETQCAVINADDPFGLQLISEFHERKPMIAYSIEQHVLPIAIPHVYAHDIELNLSGMMAKVETPWGRGELRTSLIGTFNLNNVLAVLSTLCLLDFSLQDALHLIAKLTPVPGRMQTIGREGKPQVVIDYSHTPDALEKALIALRVHCQGQLICVFGCGGDRDRGKRPLMAEIAEKFADRVIVTDDNPRTESSEQIFQDIQKGFKAPKKIVFLHDRAEAIRHAIMEASEQDGILIAGKGAETYQIIGNKKIPFSDVLQAEKCL